MFPVLILKIYTAFGTSIASNCRNVMCDFGLQVELPPADLSTPGALGQTMQLLKDVLACHDASVVAIDDKKQDFKQVLIRFYQYTNRIHPVQKDILNLIIC